MFLDLILNFKIAEQMYHFGIMLPRKWTYQYIKNVVQKKQTHKYDRTTRKKAEGKTMFFSSGPSLLTLTSKRYKSGDSNKQFVGNLPPMNEKDVQVKLGIEFPQPKLRRKMEKNN